MRLKRNTQFAFALCALILAGLACQTTPNTATPPNTAEIPLSPLVVPMVVTIWAPILTPKPTPSPIPKRICIVSTGQDNGAVNLRSCPALDCPPLDWTYEGAPLALAEPDRQPCNGWFAVNVAGRTLFIKSELCKLTEVKP